MRLVLFSLCLIFLWMSCAPSPRQDAAAATPDLMETILPDTLDSTRTSILIEKTDMQLTLFAVLFFDNTDCIFFCIAGVDNNWKVSFKTCLNMFAIRNFLIFF